MNCISISYRKADLNKRKQFVFQTDTKVQFIKSLLNTECIYECVLLSTCNRTEIYYCGNEKAEQIVRSTLSKYSSVSERCLSEFVMSFIGENALQHLFKVACGIDSMVIGEDEILRQTKEAYMFSHSIGAVSYEMNVIFQKAIACAKRIKTQTSISKTSVSIATLAANFISSFSEKMNVLVIGATGKTGSTVVKNLLSHKNITVTVTVRSHNNESLLLSKAGVKTVDYKDRYSLIGQCNCIVSATSSPHYTVTYTDLVNSLAGSADMLVIDLAVPPDIDTAIAELGGVSLYNIDYFTQLAKSNNEVKMSSVEAAHLIIGEEIDEVLKDLSYHRFLPFLNNVKENLSQYTFDKMLFCIKSKMKANEFDSFLEIMKEFK